MKTKSLQNTDVDAAKKNVSDLVVFNGDLFKLLSKAHSKEEGWMKSTKAMEIEGVGCVVQVTTQQLNDTGMWPPSGPDDMVDGQYPILKREDTIRHSVIAEAVTFVPGVKINEDFDPDGNISIRTLVKF